MAATETKAPRDACPHCGQRVKVRWRHMLPSGSRNRVFKCTACGGLYDLNDNCKIASILGGLAGMFPAMFLFGAIARAGGGSRLATLAGTAVVALSFGIVSVIACKLTFGLVAKR
jgi:hypothetical protein